MEGRVLSAIPGSDYLEVPGTEAEAFSFEEEEATNASSDMQTHFLNKFPKTRHLKLPHFPSSLPS